MRTHQQLSTLLVFLCLAVAGCNTTTVKTTDHEKITQEAAPIPEEQLLDVGIGIFDPGVDVTALPEEEEDDFEVAVYPKIRQAEARYMPYRLMETIQNSGNWGIVRIIPDRQSEMDVWVDGKILASNGSTLELEITVEESSGKIWYKKRYVDEAGKYSYDTSLSKRTEAFQNLYNQVTNDMLEYYMQLSPQEIKNIRTITHLKFAKQFSPEAFGEHLATDDQGYLYITRLPADDDPVLLRVRQIRERDYMFVDTLQEYYGSFVRQMDEPYLEWRKAYYEENKALQKVKSQANSRMIGGALAVLGGILAQGSDSRVARTAGQVGIGAGAGVFMSGLNKREEAKVHAEALEEISSSLDAEMEPHTMTLEDRTVTLSGSVNEQYSQWREILKDIYQTETGQTSSPAQQQ